MDWFILCGIFRANYTVNCQKPFERVDKQYYLLACTVKCSNLMC